MTKQEMFDQCLNFIRAQGCASANADGDCMYRGPNDTKCAAGIFIPDCDYSLSFENQSLYHTASTVYKYFLEKGHDVMFLANLQHCHDNAAADGNGTFVERFNKYMQILAFREGLQYHD